MVMSSNVLSVDDLVKTLGVHAKTVRRWAKLGKIKGKKIGRRWFFSKDVIKI